MNVVKDILKREKNTIINAPAGKVFRYDANPNFLVNICKSKLNYHWPEAECILCYVMWKMEFSHVTYGMCYFLRLIEWWVYGSMLIAIRGCTL